MATVNVGVARMVKSNLDADERAEFSTRSEIQNVGEIRLVLEPGEVRGPAGIAMGRRRDASRNAKERQKRRFQYVRRSRAVPPVPTDWSPRNGSSPER